MIYGLVERGMELREGEKLFSSRMQKAFFGSLGHRPFKGSQHIRGAGHLLETETGCVRICLNVTTTYGNGRTVNGSFAVDRAENMDEAERLVKGMNEPATLERANRTIESVPPFLANAGNIAPYVGAAGCALAAAIF